jgi:hypothetical protein
MMKLTEELSMSGIQARTSMSEGSISQNQRRAQTTLPFAQLQTTKTEVTAKIILVTDSESDTVTLLEARIAVDLLTWRELLIF